MRTTRGSAPSHRVERGTGARASRGPTVAGQDPCPRRNHQSATAASTVSAATIHQIRLPEPVTTRTAAVQVGARSRAGTASAASVGRKTQWKPSSLINTAATARSSTSLNGEAKPSPNSGATAICTASAARATPRARRTLPGVARVGSLEGAVELVGSIDDLLRKRLVHRVDRGVELLDRGRPEQDRVDARPRRDPLVRQLDGGPPGLGGEPGEGIGEVEEAVREVAALVHRVAVEPRARRKGRVALQLSGED